MCLQENTAIALFVEGIKLERKGNHLKAVRWYKKALKLDPDVEKKIDLREPTERIVDAFRKNTYCANSMCLVMVCYFLK